MAVLSAADKNFTSTMKGAAGTMDSLESSSDKTRNSILKIAGTAAIFKAIDIATNALVGSLDGAINRYDTMNRFPKIMEQIGFSTDESTASVEKLSEGIDGLPTSLDAITGSTQQIALLTGDLEKATDTSLALNNAFLASGSATADAERGLTQYTQMLSKGTVDMQSWRTLQETMGVALNELAAAFGFAGDAAQNDLYAALQSGEITFSQLNDKLVELDGGVNGFAERARTASVGIGTSFQNLQTAVVKGVTNIIGATDQMLADNGFGTLAENIDGAKGVINAASGAIASSIGTVGSTVIALSPVLKTGATMWIAYEASMGVYKTTGKVIDKLLESKKAILEAGDAMKLAAEAEKLKEKAVKASTLATKLGTKADKLSVDATKAQAAAKKLAATAEKAKAKAAAAGGKDEALNAAATKASEKAAKAKASASTKTAAAETARANATKAGTMAEAANATATTAGATAVTAKSLVLSVLSTKLTIVEAAQLGWNAALAANPIGAVLALAVALGIGLAGLGKILGNNTDELKKSKKETEELSKASNDLVKDIGESAKAHKDNISSIGAETKANETLVGKIEALSQKENKSAGDKAKLQSYVDMLNDSLGDSVVQYNAETDSLNMSTDAIRDRISAIKEQAEVAAVQERYKELLKQQYDIEEQLAGVGERRADIEKKLRDSSGESMPVLNDYNKQKQEIIATEQALIGVQDNVATSISHLDGVIAESSASQAAAVSEGTQSQITSWEDLSETQQAAIEAMSSTFNDYADAATNMFDRIDTESKASIDDMIKSLEHNRDAMANWATNMDTLSRAGIDEGLLEQLRTAGPESAGLVQELVNGMENGKLDTLSELFGQNTQDAMDAMNTVFDTSNVPDNAAGFMTRTGESMQSTIDSVFPTVGKSVPEQVAAGVSVGSPQIMNTMQDAVDESISIIDMADFATPSGVWMSSIASSVTEGGSGVKTAMTGLGTDAAAGYVSGLESGVDGITTAASSGVLAGVEAARAAQNSHSPSVVYQGLGTDAIAGYILGVTGSQGPLSAAMAATMQVAINSAKTTMTSGLRSAVSSAGTSFNLLGPLAKTGMAGMNASIKSGTATAKASFSNIGMFAKAGMITMNTAINAGMTTSNRTIQTKMKSNESVTKSGMTAMQAATRAGMNQITAAITAGMNTANSRVSSGTSSMIAKVRALQGSFYSSGAYASQGLANGINARAGAAISAAQSVANRVATIMAKALQERSPSRRTKKIGAYASEGLAIGILDELSLVERASKAVANAVADLMAPDIGSISDRLAYAGDISYGAAENMLNYTANHTYTFNITSEANGRVYAQATATYTQEELNKLEKINSRRAGIRN